MTTENRRSDIAVTLVTSLRGLETSPFGSTITPEGKTSITFPVNVMSLQLLCLLITK